jgi:hypothetical protein
MNDDHIGKGARGLAIYLIGMLAILVASCVFTIANAQTARTATITFSAPTEYTDGTSIATGAAISYRVYQGARTGTKTQVGTITSTSTTINSGLQAGQEYCWEVTAVINGQESARSNQACKAFAFPTPDTVTITVT